METARTTVQRLRAERDEKRVQNEELDHQVDALMEERNPEKFLTAEEMFEYLIGIYEDVNYCGTTEQKG
ncbi:hypothetical protein FQN57_007531, partial [Myotisia sp. PD_48]